MNAHSCRSILATTLFLLVVSRFSTGMAATTWYVNELTGIDRNSCQSATAACRTIGHAISLAASGDSVRVAAGTYAEHLTIGISLELIGAGASTTIIDGSRTGRVIMIPKAGSVVTVANVTIRNGVPTYGFGVYGAGIFNQGILTINSSTVSGNEALGDGDSYGGGVLNNVGSKLTINNSTLAGNSARCTNRYASCNAGGAGIYNNGGTVAINNSTIADNFAEAAPLMNAGRSQGGGIYNTGILTISNSTVWNDGASGGAGIYGSAHLQNSIIAHSHGRNCDGPMTSIFSLSSDNSCNLNGPGDLNNVDPKLGTFGNNGGPTPTISLLSGSPAIDAGNPSGCTDSQGHRLTTDQRGYSRPDKEDKIGCDMGAYESQSD